MGIWYIFAENVTGPSGNETGFFQYREAFRTTILPCVGNTAHSNVHTGFMLGHQLLWNQVLHLKGERFWTDTNKLFLDRQYYGIFGPTKIGVP